MDMELIARAAAKAAVEETLLSLGINAKDPLAAQRDFQVLREMREVMQDDEFQADLIHLRKWRKSIESAQAKGMAAIAGMIFTGVIGLLLVGFKDWIK